MPVLTFMREALTSFRQIGTFFPAQRLVIKAIVNALPYHPGVTIVELGAGEGCITRGILRKFDGMDFRLVVVEVNENLVRANLESMKLPPDQREARINGARVSFLCDDAFALPELLQAQGLSKVDAVLSSLPLSHCPREQRDRFLQSIRAALRDPGVFIQYRHTPRGLRELQGHFDQVQRQFALNLLPAWIYTCATSSASAR